MSNPYWLCTESPANGRVAARGLQRTAVEAGVVTLAAIGAAVAIQGAASAAPTSPFVASDNKPGNQDRQDRQDKDKDKEKDKDGDQGQDGNGAGNGGPGNRGGGNDAAGDGGGNAERLNDGGTGNGGGSAESGGGQAQDDERSDDEGSDDERSDDERSDEARRVADRTTDDDLAAERKARAEREEAAEKQKAAQRKAAAEQAAAEQAAAQAAANGTPSTSAPQAGQTPAPPQQSVTWQTVRGDKVRDYAYDAGTGTTTRSKQSDDEVRTDAFAADGQVTTVVQREDGSRKEIEYRNGKKIVTEYDEDGERVSRERVEGDPPKAPPAPPASEVGAAQFTITDRNANLVNVETDPLSGATTTVKDEQNGGQRTETYNADGSMTWTTTFAADPDRVEKGSVDARGRTVKRVYDDGEVVKENESVTRARTAPTVDPAQFARASQTVYVTNNGERADQNTLVDTSVTDQRITEKGVDVRRTVAENGVGLVVKDDGKHTVYRRTDASGLTTISRVDNKTGEVTRRQVQGDPPKPITLPAYVQADPNPQVTESTTPSGQQATTTTWSNGTSMTQYALLNGDQVVETSLPSGLGTQQRRDVDGDVVTLQTQPEGTRELSTRHADGGGVQQELPENLELPIAAVEVVNTDQPWTNVKVRDRKDGSQVASFDWDDWKVDLTTRDADTAWNQVAGEDARDSLNDEARATAAAEEEDARREAEANGEEYDEDDAPEPEEVDWHTWTVAREVDGRGELVRRQETRIGDEETDDDEDDDADTEHRADGLFEVTDEGGTTSSWRTRDPDGTSLSLVEVGPDGAIRQVNKLDPEFGADYRSVYKVDADGNVVSTLRWDESDFNNGVSDFKVRQDTDGQGYVRYGRQGTGEKGMRYVYTDATGRFSDDGYPLLTPEEAAFARENGRVVTRAVSVPPGRKWRDGEESLVVVPDWATMQLGDEMALAPSQQVAFGDYAPEGGVYDLRSDGEYHSEAPATVARFLGNEIAQGFGADGLGASTIANAAAGLAGLAAGDENALRATAGAIADEAVTELLSNDVFTGEWAGAAGAAGYLASHFISGGDLSNVSWGRGVAAPVVTSLATDAISSAAGDTLGGALGPGVGTLVGLGIDAATGQKIQIEDELIKLGATVGCSVVGTPLLGAACGALAGFLTSLFGGHKKPDDLAEEFSHDYEDHEHLTRNPFANVLNSARDGDQAGEPPWTFEDDVNLAGDLEFAPDYAGQLTRQAYLATTAPNTTEGEEAQRREDFAHTVRALAPDNPGLRPVANYLQASAEFQDASAGKDDRWFENRFAQAVGKLGLGEQFGIKGRKSDMTVAEAQVVIDEAGKRLGYDVVNPLADDTEIGGLPGFDQMQADRECAAAIEDGELPADVERAAGGDGGCGPTDGDGGDGGSAAADDWRGRPPSRAAEPKRYVGDWWKKFYAAQDRLADQDVADVIPNTFGDHDKDGIDDMADEDVYRTFLRPTYMGPGDDESYVRQVYNDRQDATAATVDQIRAYGAASGTDIDPELAGHLVQDGIAGLMHPASFAPKKAPLVLRDSPEPDYLGGIADVITTGAEAVGSLTAGNSAYTSAAAAGMEPATETTYRPSPALTTASATGATATGVVVPGSVPGPASPSLVGARRGVVPVVVPS